MEMFNNKQNRQCNVDKADIGIIDMRRVVQSMSNQQHDRVSTAAQPITARVAIGGPVGPWRIEEQFGV